MKTKLLNPSRKSYFPPKDRKSFLLHPWTAICKQTGKPVPLMLAGLNSERKQFILTDWPTRDIVHNQLNTLGDRR
jgi:hypothetical protein